MNTEDNCGISRIILHNAVQNYNNLSRAREEQNMISQELPRLLIYWKVIKTNIEKKIDEFKGQQTLLMVMYLFI